MNTRQKRTEHGKRQKRFPDTLITVAAILSNDEDCIAEYLRDASQVLRSHFTYYEILLIDNGSHDNSAAIVQQQQKHLPNIRLLQLARRYEQEIAFAAALENSIGDYVVLLDLTCDPPSLIPKLLTVAQQGYDTVVAERIDRRENSFFERILAISFYWVLSTMLGYSFSANAANYRILSRRAVLALTKIRSKNRYLRFYTASVGFKQTSIPYHRVYRRKISTSKTFFGSIHFALSIVISHSTVPLRFATYAGLVAMLVNLIILASLVAVRVVQHQFWQMLHQQQFETPLMYLLLFFIVTIMVEYIGRILQESKDQPLYFVVDELNSSVISAELNQVNVV